MIKIYYVSGKDNRKIDLTSWPYWMQTGDFLDYEKTYEKSSKRVENFSTLFKERYLTISVMGRNENEYYQNLNELHDVFEQDVANQTPGKLYFQKFYLSCYVYSSKKTEWEDSDYMLDNEIWIVPAYPSWIKETTSTFHSFETSSNNNKRYAGRYAHRYANGMTNSFIVNEHFYYSDFKLLIFGPVVNPQVSIGGNTYLVNIILEENERLEIDSRNQTIIKFQANGTQINAFHNRQKGKDFFQKIPPGRQNIVWTGEFNFELVLYEERSEPKW